MIEPPIKVQKFAPGPGAANYSHDQTRINATLDQLKSELERVGRALPADLQALLATLATLNNPQFTGTINVPIPDADPGDPLDGMMVLFGRSDGGGGWELVARKNTATVITEFVGTLA